MEQLDPSVLQNIAKFLSLGNNNVRVSVLGELFYSFEPICRKTREAVSEVFEEILGDN